MKVGTVRKYGEYIAWDQRLLTIHVQKRRNG